ncbi:hypothetical protein COW81_00645 [Candidatus Campbellbacteria bacterium CG22_combo_CG10-13_8_21_14_all_36_13]|uniref:Uncharacterized protein n=1 Tax=Candidatus Campbellbacteria bacterium CG22_combo_CG10-13_8_21_14_all_36_13 TaxID=1974529 RepID=A0A2H0E0L4_9BACT|nr:MAG: hypothetical protein COW81_00645 [Candidatus Campbellbacteria bacterium CG22_combo_CG10-13_8_21_14_all_36_13]
MKKIVIPVLAIVLLVIGYFVWAKIGNSPDTDIVLDSDISTTTEKVTIEGFDGVDAEYVVINDPGITQPNLNRTVSGLSSTSASRLSEVVSMLKDNPLNPDGWIEIGGLWKTGGAFIASSEAWEYAYTLSPKNVVALNNLGNLYTYEIVDLNKAESWYKKALEVGPKYVPTYFNMAEMYLYGFKDRKKAIDIAKQGVKELPLEDSLASLKNILESGGSI